MKIWSSHNSWYFACVLEWYIKWGFWVNPLPQVEHLNGFSPVCINTCFFKLLYTAVWYEQKVHLNIFFAWDWKLAICALFTWWKSSEKLKKEKFIINLNKKTYNSNLNQKDVFYLCLAIFFFLLFSYLMDLKITMNYLKKKIQCISKNACNFFTFWTYTSVGYINGWK